MCFYKLSNLDREEEKGNTKERNTELKFHEIRHSKGVMIGGGNKLLKKFTVRTKKTNTGFEIQFIMTRTRKEIKNVNAQK